MRTRRSLAALFAVLGLCAASTAFAQTEPASWLLKYISYYVNVGSHSPNIQEPTLLRFYGWFPYDCGGVRDAQVVDQGHIRLKLRRISEICGDTTRAWSADFNLGYLPLGDHSLTVTRTFVDSAGTDSVTESASFSFPVVDLGSPPPPPPPPSPPRPDWVVPWVAYGYTMPAQPNASQPTSIVLHGLFPYDCGQIIASSDTGNVSFTMQPGPACNDTTRTWTQSFPIGMLAAGYYVAHITEHFISPDSNLVYQGDFGFQVWPDSTTPPPPPPPKPPDYPSVIVRCLSGWYTTAPPTTGAPTTLVLFGWFPYHCGQIISAGVTAPEQVQVTLRDNPNGCSDTTLTWFQSFDLGFLPAGHQEIGITLNVEGDPVDAVVERHGTIGLEVDGREVTASVPNPFVSDTRFVVNSAVAEEVDVGIYDLHGRRVATLFKGRIAPGAREFRWSGRRDDGTRAAIGIYFSRVAFSNRVVTRKLVMLPK